MILDWKQSTNAIEEKYCVLSGFSLFSKINDVVECLQSYYIHFKRASQHIQ
jgi:hypothetical protein